jgi:hypothetical protein
LAQIATIYAHHLVTGAATFNTVPMCSIRASAPFQCAHRRSLEQADTKRGRLLDTA